EIILIAQPAAFGDVESGGATDGVIDSGVLHRGQKFSDDEAAGGFDEVFAERPPAEIIHLLDFAVGALKEGNFFLKQAPRAGVGNIIGDVLVFHRVEALDIVREAGGLQDGNVCGKRILNHETHETHESETEGKPV